MHSLRHAELKAARALEHLEAVEFELQRYYDSEPYVISRCEKPETGRRVLRIELKDPSERTYLLVGDFAHNLRSALDHVVYSLAANAARKAPDSKRIQWPNLDAKNDKSLRRQTEGVPDEATAIIEALQPYHEGPGDAYKRSALWQLHMLDIIDKHRRVAFEQHSLDSFIPGATPASDIIFEARDSVYDISFPLSAPPVEMRLATRPDVRFGDAEEGVSLNVVDLAAIHQFVAGDVLPRFTRFFGRSATA